MICTFVDIDVNTPGFDRRIVPGHLDDPNFRRKFEWTFDTPTNNTISLSEEKIVLEEDLKVQNSDDRQIILNQH